MSDTTDLQPVATSQEYETRCSRCLGLFTWEHNEKDKLTNLEFEELMNEYMQKSLVEHCPACKKDTVHLLVSWQNKPPE